MLIFEHTQLHPDVFFRLDLDRSWKKNAASDIDNTYVESMSSYLPEHSLALVHKILLTANSLS
jgi:hypothetical protein